MGWRWEPNYCVGNYYTDESNFLGAHSDPVESIGPFAIVASLTFGAARHFRMKPVGTVKTPSHREGGRITSFSIRLPHNSLLICWEGFQEFWRHEVPKETSKNKGRYFWSCSNPRVKKGHYSHCNFFKW